VLKTSDSSPVTPLLFSLLHSSSVVSHRAVQLRLAGRRVDRGSEEGIDA
jgi:hypothetical protein